MVYYYPNLDQVMHLVNLVMVIGTRNEGLFEGEKLKAMTILSMCIYQKL
jgi:hypothetical protein